MLPITTCFVAGLPYLLHPAKLGTIQETINPDALIPVTLLTTDEIFGDLEGVLDLFNTVDDVFVPDFGSILVEKTSSNSSRVQEDARQVYHMDLINALEGFSELPSGPYFLHGPNLYQAWRLYDDEFGAFTFGVVPDDFDQPNEYQPLTSSSVQGDSVTIPVPSRLYYPQPSVRKPLSGVRVSISDTISLKGTHTTFSSRAWKSLYKDPSNATANYVQELLDQGAIIVGKTRTAQFGTGAEWVDHQAPWSARGDGYHVMQGGSVGAASALVGYEWLDHSVGVDDGRVVTENGVYSIQTANLSTDGVKAVSSSKETDFVPKIIIPTDLSSSEETQKTAIDKFLSTLQDVLDTKPEYIDVSETWQGSPPADVSEGMQSFMNEAPFRSWCYDYYHTFDDFKDEYQQKFHRQPFIEATPQFFWTQCKSVTEEEHREDAKRLDIYRKWFHDKFLNISTNSKAKNTPILILPCGDSQVKHRNEPVPPPTIYKGIDSTTLAPVLGANILSFPFTQVSYESDITGTTEYQPVKSPGLTSPVSSHTIYLNLATTMAEPANTPVPASTPRATSPAPHQSLFSQSGSFLSPKLSVPPSKPRVLHIGDAIKYNPDTYLRFSVQCEILRPSAEERQRPEFIKALEEKRWGDFDAIFRPFWGTGGEMGKWDAELINLLPESVKVFASAGAGFDWADTKLLGERGIIYCNSGLAAAEAVADFAMAGIISTFRVLPWCMSSAMSGDEEAFSINHRDATMQSHNLRNQALGLIGFGNIGQQIAARARHGFGMDIHYYDILPKPSSVIAPLRATHHETLKSLLSRCDCVVLCTPAGDGTLINETTLPLFKRGSRFVNIARGSLVDEEALVAALRDGTLSNAAIDVHANEPKIHPQLRELAKQGRVLLTCHNAGGTVDTHKGFEELSMRNIMAVLSGGEAITPVNLQFLK
ncbi:hypothetical protein FLONG3_90 [Fusarium longipes]|uniref:D-mandelate dehydrogenase n=1 Tax=Fusarium longipes TaxID=694270 RepID=A0A395TB76_9HYPO|nr:hypothetical protein FLONG3_90 [Fusarium longipes]